MKKHLPLAAAFFMPLLILFIVCIWHGIYPFGDQCMLHVDMYHQYCPFFAELMNKLKNGESLFYSWNIGLGSDFLSLYAYYLASPCNWILLICPQDYIIEIMTVLVLLKISLAGLTFGCYLWEHFKTDHFAIAVFGTAYALSGFVAAYAWNIMWLDVIVLAPLAILGVERLIRGESPCLYYVSLALAVLGNYYMAVMLCIFLVFWFLFGWLEHYVLQTSEQKMGPLLPWLRFAIYSLLAGGTGAVLIFPTAVVLGNSGTQGISFPSSVQWYFNLIAELSRHALMTEAYTGQEHWPNLYCGVFAMVLFGLYLLNREITWKKKWIYLLFWGFMVVSFANNILDFIWHGLRFPTSLPGRWSFLYIFLVLVLSFEEFCHLKGTRLWQIWCVGAVLGVFLMCSYRLAEDGAEAKERFILTAVWMLGYLVILSVCIAGRAKIKRGMLLLGGFAMLAELLLNFTVTGLATTGRNSYVADWADYKNVLETVEEEQEGSFFRTEKYERKTKNDAALLGYASATQFSSLMNINVSHFYQKLGMEGGKNFYCYNGATPLLSAMLSVRYLLSDNALEEGELNRLVDNSGDVFLYENAYVLPLGFMMDEDVAEAWWDEDDTVQSTGKIGMQNKLASLLGASEEMLVPAVSESKAGVSTVTADENGYYYATYASTDIENLQMETDSGRSRSYSKVSHNYTLDLGYCKAGETVSISNTSGETLNITAYRLNMDAFITAFDTLNQQTMELTSVTDTSVQGHITVEKAGRLIFSIAKEEGWNVYVDGVQVEPQSFADAWLSVPLSEGEHDIVLRYRSPGFAAGAVVSLSCVAVFVLLMLLRHRMQ
jgi:uncharacterized membrane protein YfhO